VPVFSVSLPGTATTAVRLVARTPDQKAVGGQRSGAQRLGVRGEPEPLSPRRPHRVSGFGNPCRLLPLSRSSASRCAPGQQFPPRDPFGGERAEQGGVGSSEPTFLMLARAFATGDSG
jgi:hypothetical protein